MEIKILICEMRSTIWYQKKTKPFVEDWSDSS